MAERTKRTGNRFAQLGGRDRVLAILLVALFGAVPFAAAALALTQGWQPTGDVAVIGLRSADVFGGDLPLLGQTSTAEELTGTPANHPGPIEYYVVAVASLAVGDRAGLVLGAAALNAAALAGVAWLSFRRGGTALLALVAMATAGLIAALGVHSLYDPFNAELATYPMLLAVLATWSVVVGDLRVAPVLAAATVVVAQVHLAGAAFSAPVLLLAAIVIGAAWYRHRRAVERDAPWLWGAVAILVLGWLPPLFYEAGGDPSNVAALWKAATIERPRLGLAFTLERVATAVAPIPVFLRDTGRFGFTQDSSAVAVFAAAALVAASLSLGIAHRRANRTVHGLRFAQVVLLVGAVSVIANAGQPPLSAFRADGTRWLWVFSLGIWVSVAWSIWGLLPDRWRDRSRSWLLVGGTVVSVVVLGAALATGSLEDQRDGALMDVTERAGDELVDRLPEGTYHVTYEGNTALVTVGPGLVHRLEASGSDVVLDRNVFTRGYGDRRTETRPTDGSLRISSNPGLVPEPGEEVLVEVPVDPDDPDAGTITVLRS